MERSPSHVEDNHQQDEQTQEQSQAQQQQQQQRIAENKEFGGRIHQEEKNDEKEEDDDVDEPALKKPKLPPRIPGSGRHPLKRALQAATAAAAGSADTTADLSAITAAAAAKTPEKLVLVAIDFLEKMAIEFPNCTDGPKRTARKCSCFSIFRRTDTAAAPNQVTVNTARYMVYFQQLRKKEQYPLFIKWIMAARQQAQQVCRLKKVLYALPSFDNDGGSRSTTTDINDATNNNYYNNNNRNGPPFFVCQSALLRILDKGPGFWTTCRNAVDAGGAVPVHGLAANISNRHRKFVESGGNDDAKSFLEGLVEFATGTGENLVSPRDGETHEILELDATITKRQLYIEYAFERGWIVTKDSHGTWTTKEREADQDDWNPVDKKVIMTRDTFMAFWLKFFPYLRVSHGKNNNQEHATTNHRTRLCQGFSGGNYFHLIQASAGEALNAALQANVILPRTFPLAPTLEERFENYGMVEVRAEEENCSEEQGKTTATTNNKENYVIRSKLCDGVGNVRGICKSCSHVSHSIANLSMRLALQSSTP